MRLASAGADPSADTVAAWMTADPDCVAPDLDATAAFVQKPFTGEGLVRKVREVLDATKIG